MEKEAKLTFFQVLLGAAQWGRGDLGRTLARRRISGFGRNTNWQEEGEGVKRGPG